MHGTLQSDSVIRSLARRASTVVTTIEADVGNSVTYMLMFVLKDID